MKRLIQFFVLLFLQSFKWETTCKTDLKWWKIFHPKNSRAENWAHQIHINLTGHFRNTWASLQKYGEIGLKMKRLIMLKFITQKQIWYSKEIIVCIVITLPLPLSGSHLHNVSWCCQAQISCSTLVTLLQFSSVPPFSSSTFHKISCLINTKYLNVARKKTCLCL